MLYETDRPQWTAFQVFKRTHQIIVFINPCFAWSIKSRGWCVPCTCPADPHTGTMSFVGSIRWAAWALQCFRLCSFAPLFLPLRSGCSKPKTSAEQSVAAPAIKVKFYSRCKILGKVAESFSKAIFTHLVLFKIPTFFGVFLASYHCIRLLSDISCFSGPSFGRLFKRFPDTWILLCQDLKKSCEFSFQVQGVRATFWYGSAN